MKTKLAGFFLTCFTGLSLIHAQQRKPLSLSEAVKIALENSDASKIANTKVTTAKSELQLTKNNQYPEVSLSGQYLYLTHADVALAPSTGSDSNETDSGESSKIPNVNHLALGQANISLPIFSGFKLKNAIAASEKQFEAAGYTAINTLEQIALQTITDYLNLYKANKTIALLQENLKSASQRVIDFTAMETNGILARNDLLKAQLQESNVKLTLEEAKKNRNILNYRLAITLKLSKNTIIETSDSDFGNTPPLIQTDTVSRNDLKALHSREKAAEHQIKVAQSAYYPSLSLSGGYIALDLNNALTVKNAMNVGVGVSYDLSNIFKTKGNVKVARSRAQELQYTYDMLSDQVQVQIENSQQDYELALKKRDVYLKSQEQAIENYRIVKDKYDNGLQDTNDLLEADVDQLQSKINLAYAKADITEKYFRLLSAKGILTTQFIK